MYRDIITIIVPTTKIRPAHSKTSDARGDRFFWGDAKNSKPAFFRFLSSPLLLLAIYIQHYSYGWSGSWLAALAAGGWWLAAGCWLLAAGCWLLAAPAFFLFFAFFLRHKKAKKGRSLL